jgi:hypothetical protein
MIKIQLDKMYELNIYINLIKHFIQNNDYLNTYLKEFIFFSIYIINRNTYTIILYMLLCKILTLIII